MDHSHAHAHAHAHPPSANAMLKNHQHHSSLEEETLRNYHPPSSAPPSKPIHWVYNPVDGSVLHDHHGRPVSIDRLLATKPLRGELSTRPGPGNKKLTYISGDGVTRTLNDVFGYGGWNLEIVKSERENCIKDESNGKFCVTYTSMVRVTHRATGAFREDCGAGDATDRVYGTAVANAMKASITDGMKRAARHFGDKLGNSLYQGNFSVSKAPVTLKDALDRYDIERANCKFGFPKDQTTKQQQNQQQLPAGPAIAETKPILPSTTAASNPPSHAITAQNNISNNSGRILPASASSVNQNDSSSSSSNTQAVAQPRQNGNQSSWSSNTSSNRPDQQPSSSIPSRTTATAQAYNPNSNNVSTSSTSAHQQPRQPTKGSVAPVPAPVLRPTNGPVLPPPTPMDSLRNSALFSASLSMEEEETTSIMLMMSSSSPTTARAGALLAGNGPPAPALASRPRSSYGHNKASISTTTSGSTGPALNPTVNDARRTSIGDGVPIQPLPLVTPTASTNTTTDAIAASSSKYCHPPHPYAHKRPALNSIPTNSNHHHGLDQTNRTASKRPATTTTIAAANNPYHHSTSTSSNGSVMNHSGHAGGGSVNYRASF